MQSHPRLTPIMPYSILLTSRGAQRDRACAELQEAFERLKGGSKVVFGDLASHSVSEPCHS